MLGLIFIILTYLVVVAVCFLLKQIKLKLLKVKNEEKSSAVSKIYYVTNSSKKAKTVRKKPDIAIKGSIIEKIEDE